MRTPLLSLMRTSPAKRAVGADTAIAVLASRSTRALSVLVAAKVCTSHSPACVDASAGNSAIALTLPSAAVTKSTSPPAPHGSGKPSCRERGAQDVSDQVGGVT